MNRAEGRTGFCQAGAEVEVYRYGLHRGEEPPISGTTGSGAVFFSRCTMRCIYCQNYPWSADGQGGRYSIEELAGIFRRLADQGCANWNLVSPTPWLPQIVEALELAARTGRRLPVVYNTSGFERVETIERIADFVDVYLTDLRYARAQSAADGSGTAGYVDAARRALAAMWTIAGPLQEREGVAVRGVICRLLILPGRAAEAVDNLRWMADRVGTEIAVSIMAQYVPLYQAAATEGWNRRIARSEYDGVCREAERLGFDTGWIQEFDGPTAAELIGCDMKPGGDPGQ